MGAVGAPFAALEQNIPLSEAYAQGRDIMRGAAESYEQESPYKAAGGQMVASLPMALAACPALSSEMLVALRCPQLKLSHQGSHQQFKRQADT